MSGTCEPVLFAPCDCGLVVQLLRGIISGREEELAVHLLVYPIHIQIYRSNRWHLEVIIKFALALSRAASRWSGTYTWKQSMQQKVMEHAWAGRPCKEKIRSKRIYQNDNFLGLGAS